jgi:hypothetical protein
LQLTFFFQVGINAIGEGGGSARGLSRQGPDPVGGNCCDVFVRSPAGQQALKLVIV